MEFEGRTEGESYAPGILDQGYATTIKDYASFKKIVPGITLGPIKRFLAIGHCDPSALQ